MIIKNGLILTMDKQNRVLKGYSILIKGNKIEKICKTGTLKTKGEEIINARGKIILPGFISIHTHSIHSLLRGGKEEGKALYEWLEKVVFTGLKRYTRKDVYNAARLWHKEALQAGITTFLDSSDYGSIEKIYKPALKAHKRSRMRVLYSYYFFDKKSQLDVPVQRTEEALKKIEQLMIGHNSVLLKICPAPAEPHFVSKKGLLGSLELAKKYNVPVTLHVSEIENDSKINGIPTIEYLHKIGFLSEKTLLAHCTWINNKEIRLLKKTKTKVAHNPTANAFLADGIMPLKKLLDNNITVGIGMDDPNCNSNVNMLSNLKFMCLIQKSSTLNPKAVTSIQALRLATIEAAKCIGLDKEIGSIEEGKKADIILVDTKRPNQLPFKNPFFNLVYQCYGNEVTHSIINGEIIWQR